MTHRDDDRHVFEIVRPDAKLWTYYIVSSFIVGPFFWVALIPLYFRYHTMHYRFDQEGISMGWGILFRREIHLTYSRIQDIHLVANFIERWLGLARIQIQTASGSSSAEMTLEGLLRTDEVRDFLYSRMRGAKDSRAGARPSGAVPMAATDSSAHDLAEVLTEVAAELRGVRLALESARERKSGDA